jgi:3,4-dihydroxy 2-butanone 4-phosphate synthase/GTP cyclohydrolase II
MSLAPIEDAVAIIAAGGMVVVVDDEERENEGDLIMAADAADAASLAFIINHTSGVVCVPMLGEDLQRLSVPMMVARNEDPKRTAYTVSVDARTAFVR